MPIRIPCPSCRANLKLADRLAGKAIKCPKCASVVRVPAAPAPTAPEDAPVDVLEEVDEDAAYGVKENEEVPRRRAKAVGRGLSLDDVPGRLRRWVEEELSRREWLLWAGRPNGWLVVGRGVPVLLVLLFFLSLFGCGGLCFVALGLNPKGAGMMSGGVIIKGVGVAALALMFVGMALWHLWRVYLQTRAGYALTDRRAIIWSVAWNGRVEVESYEPRAPGEHAPAGQPAARRCRRPHFPDQNRDHGQGRKIWRRDHLDHALRLPGRRRRRRGGAVAA